MAAAARAAAVARQLAGQAQGAGAGVAGTSASVGLQPRRMKPQPGLGGGAMVSQTGLAVVY